MLLLLENPVSRNQHGHMAVLTEVFLLNTKGGHQGDHTHGNTATKSCEELQPVLSFPE